MLFAGSVVVRPGAVAVEAVVALLVVVLCLRFSHRWWPAGRPGRDLGEAWRRFHRAEFADAAAGFEGVLWSCWRRVDAHHRVALHAGLGLAMARRRLGEFVAAENGLLAMWADYGTSRPPYGEGRSSILAELAGVKADRGFADEAVMMARELVAELSERRGQQDRRVLLAHVVLGVCCWKRARRRRRPRSCPG